MPFIFTITTTGGGGDDMTKADLSSQVDGSTQQFTVPEPYVSGSLRVYYNGLRQIQSVTYNENTSTTFSFTFTPLDGSKVEIDYVAVS